MSVESMHLVTRDADVAHRFMDQVFSPARPIVLRGDGQPFRFELQSTTADCLGSDRACIGIAAEAHAPPANELVVMTIVEGELDYSAGPDRLLLRSGEVVRVSDVHDGVSRWEHASVMITRLSWGALERAAQAQHGVPPAALRFCGVSPLDAAAGKQWRTLGEHVRAVLTTGSAEAELVRAQLTEQVARTALTVFANTTLGHRPAPIGTMRTAALRRAIAYIDDHAHEPITLTDIVEAAGTTARALQASFQRHQGCTPTAYLRSVRLHGARGELLRAGVGDGSTVAGIAARWGFAHAARFARDYRITFGEPPGQTLRR